MQMNGVEELRLIHIPVLQGSLLFLVLESEGTLRAAAVSCLLQPKFVAELSLGCRRKHNRHCAHDTLEKESNSNVEIPSGSHVEGGL